MKYATLITIDVGTGEWEFLGSCGERERLSSSYLVFCRQLELPFVPYPGLRLSSKGWLPGAIESVRFDLDSNQFICAVAADHSVPDEIQKLCDSERIIDEDIEDWLKIEVRKVKARYKAAGWRLFEPLGVDDGIDRDDLSQ